MATITDTQRAIERFGRNEERANVFVNAPKNETHYTTESDPVKSVETLPHLVNRIGKIASSLLDQVFLESGVYNVRATFAVPEKVASGSIITLPSPYFPTRNTLYLSYGGAVCSPAWTGIMSDFQYEEIGTDPNEVSYQIKILFDADPGIAFDMWVVTSALGKNLDAMEAIRALTAKLRDEAAISATSAQESVDMIEKLISVGMFESGIANHRQGFVATTAVASGGILTLPIPYYPLRAVLLLSYGGTLCMPKSASLEGTQIFQYEEIGTDPAVQSTQVRVHFDVAVGDVFDVWVAASMVGRNIDAIQAMRDAVAAMYPQIERWYNEIVEMVTRGFDASQIKSGTIDTARIAAAGASTAAASGTSGLATYAADNDTTSRNKSVTPAGLTNRLAEFVPGTGGGGTVDTVDGVAATISKNVQLKFAVTQAAYDTLKTDNKLIRGARYLITDASNDVNIGIVREILILESSIAAGANFFVPTYVVGSNTLGVYLNGFRCYPGATNAYQYKEIGTAGTSSERIQFHDELIALDEIMMEVISGGSFGTTISTSSGIPITSSQYLHIQDQKPSSTTGGTFVSGAWRDRDLNTIIENTITGASLANNQITLPAGTYFIEAASPGYTVTRHCIRLLINETELYGMLSFAAIGTGFSLARLAHKINITSTAIIKLQHMCATTVNNQGMGLASGWGPVEVYSDIKIWKIA